MADAKGARPHKSKRSEDLFQSDGNFKRPGEGKPVLDAEGEPLSLAEELAEEADQERDEVHEHYEQIKQGDIHIAELQRMAAVGDAAIGR